MTSPVMQALANARKSETLDGWKRNEDDLAVTVKRMIGDYPAPTDSPERTAALSAFMNWCELKGVKYCPASPVTLALFVLENASLGVAQLCDVVRHIADMHEAVGLGEPGGNVDCGRGHCQRRQSDTAPIMAAGISRTLRVPSDRYALVSRRA